MEEKITLGILAERFDNFALNITDKVEQGFKGVHERQDRTNGNIIKHDKEIVDLKLENKGLRGDLKSLKINWGAIGVLMAVIMALLGKYVL